MQEDVNNISKKSNYIPLIKEIWFNSFQNTFNNGDKIFSASQKNANVSIKKQLKFNELMNFANKKIAYMDYISTDKIKKPLSINEIKIVLLSPNDKKLNGLYSKYKKELSSTNISTSKYAKDLEFKIEELASNVFNENGDNSVSNGSSIAFILIYQYKKFLFLGDAHIALIVEKLKKHKNYFNNNGQIEFEFIKLSHHGSKNNINKDFLNLVRTDNYIILTDSTGKNRHPDKETLSKILVHHKKNRYSNKVNFIFNYSAGANFNRYNFTNFDKKNYNFELIQKNIYTT